MTSNTELFTNLSIYANYSAWTMIATSIILLIYTYTSKIYGAGYGRHYNKNDKNFANKGFLIDAKIAWIVMESASWVGVLLTILLVNSQLEKDAENQNLWNQNSTYHKKFIQLVTGIIPYVLHYIHRANIYPFFTNSTAPMTCVITSMAMAFCAWNGTTQTLTLFGLFQYEKEQNIEFNYYGLIIFCLGLAINMSADYTLLLIKAENKGYQVPNNLLYRFFNVSSLNYFGELVEWSGFAIFNDNRFAPWAFVVFTFANLAPRAYMNHLWYVDRFGEKLPKNRKILIPYVW